MSRISDGIEAAISYRNKLLDIGDSVDCILKRERAEWFLSELRSGRKVSSDEMKLKFGITAPSVGKIVAEAKTLLDFGEIKWKLSGGNRTKSYYIAKGE